MPTSGPARVLLVDDSEDMRVLIRLQLDRIEGVEVIGEATDGLQAVRRCAQLEPDLVLLDITMPHLDGVAAMQQIRAASPATEVIVVSAYDSGPRRDLVIAHGALDYISKFDGIAAISSAINRWLASRTPPQRGLDE